MGKIGSNGPCPCGSGRKYKQCCLDKDKDKSRAVPLSPAEEKYIEDDDAETRGREDSDLEQFRDEFEMAPLDDKLRLAFEYIEHGGEFDGEIAFEIIEGLYAPLRQAGRFEEFERTMKRVAELRPEAYEEQAGWFNLWRADAALWAGQDLEPPLMALAERLDENIFDPFMYLVDKLRYHGRVKELGAAMVKAGPAIKEMPGILTNGIDEFEEIGAALLIGECLDADPDLKSTDPEFLERIKPFNETSPEWLEEIVAQSSGRSRRQWRIGDFQGPDQDLLSKYLFLLTLDFKAALCGKWGWTHSRAAIAQDQLYKYLSGKFWDSLKGKKTLEAKKAESSLLPDPESTDRHLADHLQFMVPQPYKAAAFSLALPLWLEFLAERGLCDAEKAEALRAALAAVMGPLPRILGQVEDDPGLVSDVMSCWGINKSDMREPMRTAGPADVDDLFLPLITSGITDEIIIGMSAGERERIEDKSLKPDARLASALKKLPAIWVEGICRQTGMDKPSRNKDRIKALEEGLPLERTLVCIWRKLPEGSRRMLEYILGDQGGHVRTQKLSRKFGKDEDVTWFWNEGQTPATPLGLLRVHGLVFVGKTTVDNRRVKIAVVPVELREGLSKILESPGAFDGAPPPPETDDGPPPPEYDDKPYTFNDSIKIEVLAAEEELPFISEFIEQFPFSGQTRHNYEWMLETVRGSEEEGSRDLLRRILERMAESKHSGERLAAYKEGYKEFGESFIKPALEDKAETVRRWAGEIICPRQGRLF